MKRCCFALICTSSIWAQPPEEFPKIEVSGYFTSGSFTGGGSSSGLSEYLQVHLDGRSKIYAGHSQTNYRDTAAFPDGVRQNLINLGGVTWLDDQQYLVLDYFHLGDSQNGASNMFSLEYDRIFEPGLTAGLAVNHSSYPGYTVQQIVPRVIWWPDPSLCLNSRVYLTTSGGNSRLCLSEKVSYFPNPDWELQLGGVLGSSLNRIDNDTSTIYTQPQIQNGSYFVGLKYRPAPDVQMTLIYERAFFQGYQVGYLTGGASIRF